MTTSEDQHVYTEPPRRSIIFQPRIMAGVLFSVSKSLFGEIYPVYMGYNSIGSDKDCDIPLLEGSVVASHAHIHVSRDEVTGEYTASFCDPGSESGSSVNGSDARFETLLLNDGDTLDIGRHYRFLFRLFNPDHLPLFENEDFEDISEPDDENGASAGDTPANLLTNLNQPLTVDFYAPSAKPDGNDRTVMV